MARPRAGDWFEDEVENWRTAGVQVVVSLLEREEENELGLEAEADLCRSRGIDFVSFPIADRGVPTDPKAATELAHRLGRSDRAIAIHCRAGIGRSSLVAALVLTHRGVKSDIAFSLIQAARGVAVPDTEQQRDWINRLGC